MEHKKMANPNANIPETRSLPRFGRRSVFQTSEVRTQ
jgi:hypothetical protein